MGVPLHLVDAFTAEPFAGNPAAVCVLDGEAPSSWMQAVATEIGWSETAFVRPRHGGPGTDPVWSLRWFTPTVEIDLCGHATLATAHVLWESGRLGAGADARFDTRRGRLDARRTAAGEVELDFPGYPPTVDDSADTTALAAALGVGAEGISAVARGRDLLLVELAGAELVRRLAPDSAALATLHFALAFGAMTSW